MMSAGAYLALTVALLLKHSTDVDVSPAAPPFV